MATEQDEFIPTRRSLLIRLRDLGDQRSWQVFFDTYARLIYNTARRAGLNDAAAQDVVQETVLAVTKTMPGYEYDPAVCSFKGWLLFLTRRRIADHLRQRRREPSAAELAADDATTEEALENLPDEAALPSEANWDVAWERNLAEAAIERAKRQVSALQYQIFDAYVVKQWPAREVARALKVSKAQVYLAKHRVGGLIRKERERLEKEFG
jgi:RNA polymerase sigma-70 factor (ECF subfamily)